MPLSPHFVVQGVMGFAVLADIAASMPANAQVSENIRYQHYPVLFLPDRSLVELASPIVGQGRIFHGDVR